MIVSNDFCFCYHVFCFQSLSDFEKFNRRGQSLCHCQYCHCVCVCLCLYIASHISEISKAIAIKISTVTTSVTRMHHMLIILTLTFIQGRTVHFEFINYYVSRLSIC